MGKIISARDLNIKHFTRRPYPIDPAFFGQNFIPLSLSSVSRRSPNRMNNDVFVRNGPSSVKLGGRELVDYIHNNFLTGGD